MVTEIMKKQLKNLSADIAIIKGSGYDDIIKLENPKKVSYKSLGFVYGEIPGHSRDLVFGDYLGKKIVLVSRFHYYETASTDNIFALFELLSYLKVKIIIATTAVGGINADYDAGDIMLIKSHINLTGTNPLLGKSPLKFIDLNNAYDKEIRNLIKNTALKMGLELHEGVHIQACGPTYETPAEVRFYRQAGADTVSMSTALDNICANYFGMKFVGFAGISNRAVNENSKPICHEDVLKVAKGIKKNLSKIISKIIPKLPV